MTNLWASLGALLVIALPIVLAGWLLGRRPPPPSPPPLRPNTHGKIVAHPKDDDPAC